MVGAKSIALLSMILLLASTSAVTAQQPDTVIVTVISSDATGMTLKIDFPAFQSSQVRVGDHLFDVLELPGCGKTNELGNTALPRYGMMVALEQLPAGYWVTAYVQDSTSLNLSDYFVYPVQEPGEDQLERTYPPFPTPEFTMDETFYNTSQFYPDPLIEYGPIGTLRELKILPVLVAAFQHNPVTGELIVYSSITVRIDYQGELRMATRPGASSSDSGYFEGMYSTLVGYVPSPDLVTGVDAGAGAVLATGTPLGTGGNGGCDFLIITDPELEPAADNLSARRNAQGISTLVVNTTVTGTTAEQIKAYIQTAYDTWSPRPSFLLLLGEANHIPPFYKTVHLSVYYPTGHRTGTDLYYAILNGPEAAAPYYQEYWTPDLFYGRISVENLPEANTVIAKIFAYEDNQWLCGENKAAVCGFFQDGETWIAGDEDGFEDRRFILTSEEIRDYLIGEGFVVDRLYTTEAHVDPTNYNNGDYDLGLPLPAALLRPAYPWNAGTADITTAINDGRFVVFHRDHGGSLNRPSSPVEGWGDPEFEASDVPSLTNEAYYTIIFSINCETGWFDGETDDDYTARNFDCLCEAFLRQQDGGAAGVFGATRISTSGWNDDLAKGFVDAIWPNFDPVHGSATPLLRAGEILNYGRQYMYTHDGWPWDVKKRQYELFHYFGDPTMAFKIPTYEPPQILVGGPYAGDENETIEFTVSVSVACSPIVSYEWDFDTDSIFEVNSTTGTINHTWCDNGIYPVTLRVTDEEGFSSTVNISVNISNIAPTVTAGPDLITDAYKPVTFNGSFIDPGCDNWTFEWDFGDGNSITGTLTPTHVYSQPQIYTVNLTVRDDDGGVGYDTLTVTVYSSVPATTPPGLVVLSGLLAAFAVVTLSRTKRH